MSNNKSLLTLVLGVLLTGCSTTAVNQENTYIEPLTNAQVCCDSFAQYPLIELNTNESVDFNIDKKAPIGSFDNGNAYFNAFKFSSRSKEVEIELHSLMLGKTVLAPRVLLLNENFEPVRTIQLSEFSIRTSTAFTRSQYQIKQKINAEQTPYMVIYSDQSDLGKTVKVDHPAKVRAKEFGEVMPMVTDPSYTHSRFGKLELSVKTLSLRSTSIAKPKVISKVQVQPETTQFYHSAIEQAVAKNDIPKALSLLEEAKALGVTDAQKVFVQAVNNK